MRARKSTPLTPVLLSAGFNLSLFLLLHLNQQQLQEDAASAPVGKDRRQDGAVRPRRGGRLAHMHTHTCTRTHAHTPKHTLTRVFVFSSMMDSLVVDAALVS